MKPFSKGIDGNVCLRTRKQKPLMNTAYKANYNLQKACRKLILFLLTVEKTIKCTARLSAVAAQHNSGLGTPVPSKQTFLSPNHSVVNLFIFGAVLHKRR